MTDFPQRNNCDNRYDTLAGKTALVTGASGGIGRAVALCMARAGADIIVHGHDNVAAARAIAADITELGRRADIVIADLGTPAGRSAVVDVASRHDDHLDILVNTAGADVLTGPLAETTFEEKLSRLWHVDVVATMHLSRLLGRKMVERQRSGAIITIGWDQAETGMAGDSGEMFAAVKGAIMAFTRSLAKSLAPCVRVNCIAPGWIRTGWGAEAPPYWQARAVGEALRGRWGTTDDVANAALFLASDLADFVNGHVLPVNGGLQAWPNDYRQNAE
ncbi:MAG: SDR family oxidoreductase [Pirellulaceae bacterium]|nr:SDR family oxidoreductase [Planctomycetales bacterium]